MVLKQNRIFRFLVAWMNRHFPVMLTRLRFKMYFGRMMNVKNPQDLNEKILWLSLFSDTTEWSRLTDKYAVRQYVEDVGGAEYLVKLYGKWDRVEDIEWDKLPDKFVLKCNNGGSANAVKIVRDKSLLNIEELKQTMRGWLTKEMSPDQTEYHYIDVKPCIIAEQLLENPESIKAISNTLIDYKIWCFNGKVSEIWTCANRTLDGADVATFDLLWNYHPEGSVFTKDYNKQKQLVPKPKNLDVMISLAEKLSAPFPVVRVDLYNIGGKVYFGEMTFTSNGGIMDFYTQEHLLELGRQIDLSGIKKDRINRPHKPKYLQ